MILAAADPSPLWYLSRGTGAITLVLLSMTVLLGIGGTLRWRPGARTPRFVVDGLHRNVSLLVVVLLAAHILTALLDPFAHLRVLDAVVPFGSHYRPLWLGFGALAFDLLLALIITSLVRARLGLRAWRAMHWAAYLCWPVAALHGLGTGTDARSVWLQVLTAVCVGAVVIAAAARLLRDWPARAGMRVVGLAVVAIALASAVVFAVRGPLAQGWARRAGTPTPLLTASMARAVVTPAPALALPFAAPLSGIATNSRSSRDGSVRVDIAASILLATAPARLEVRLFERPSRGGGPAMSSSSVALGPSARPDLYRGRVVSLSGNSVVARLASGARRAVLLRMVLRVDASGAVAGSASARESGA